MAEERYLPTQRSGAFRPSPLPGRPEQMNLADILERVLDIELLTIKLRLLIASVERAKEMGINWWEGDTSLQSLQPENGDDRRLERENRDLRERLDRLERQRGVGEEDPAAREDDGDEREPDAQREPEDAGERPARSAPTEEPDA